MGTSDLARAWSRKGQIYFGHRLVRNLLLLGLHYLCMNSDRQFVPVICQRRPDTESWRQFYI